MMPKAWWVVPLIIMVSVTTVQAQNRMTPRQRGNQQVDTATISALAASDSGTGFFSSVKSPRLQQMFLEEMGFTPQQIRMIQGINRQYEKARNDQPDLKRRKPRTVTVSLEPGSNIPTIKVSKNSVTTVEFRDVTGAPWPIDDRAVGQPEWYTIEKMGDRNSMMTVSTNQYGVTTDFSMTLRDLSTSLIMRVDASDSVVDRKVTLQIDRKGPNARETIVKTPDFESTGKIMTKFVDGVPPEKAERLETSPDFDGAVWAFANSLYIRTKQSVILPDKMGIARGPGNLRVFRTRVTPEILLSTDDGTSKRISIEDEIPYLPDDKEPYYGGPDG